MLELDFSGIVRKVVMKEMMIEYHDRLKPFHAEIIASGGEVTLECNDNMEVNITAKNIKPSLLRRIERAVKKK
jgi:hypothetical protein